MIFRSKHHVPAPISQVRHALSAIDEYPAWNTAVRFDEGRLLWSVPLGRGHRRVLDTRVLVTPRGALVTIGERSRLRIVHCVQLVAAGHGDTDIFLTTSISGLLRPLAGRSAFLTSVSSFGSDLGGRARWLRHAPDTSFASCVLDQTFPAQALDASLEQLRPYFRELERGILTIDVDAARWLIDVNDHRFMRADQSNDPEMLALFGRWRSLSDLQVDGADLVLTPENGTTVRICRALHAEDRRGDTGRPPLELTA